MRDKILKSGQVDIKLNCSSIHAYFLSIFFLFYFWAGICDFPASSWLLCNGRNFLDAICCCRHVVFTLQRVVCPKPRWRLNFISFTACLEWLLNCWPYCVHLQWLWSTVQWSGAFHWNFDHVARFQTREILCGTAII